VATYLLRVRDITGLEIRMTRECWEEHILVRHPVMRRYFDLLPKTVASPDVVHHSPTPREARFYYRRLPGRRSWALVIADVKPSGRLGYVKTAMLVDRIRPREILWPRP
jgi:hypothetical protein